MKGKQRSEKAVEIGKRIAQARNEAGGMTQRELGELIGVSRAWSIAAYELGDVIPYRYLKELQRVLGTPAAWLLHGAEATDVRDRQLDEILYYLRHHGRTARRDRSSPGSVGKPPPRRGRRFFQPYGVTIPAAGGWIPGTAGVDAGESGTSTGSAGAACAPGAGDSGGAGSSAGAGTGSSAGTSAGTTSASTAESSTAKVVTSGVALTGACPAIAGRVCLRGTRDLVWTSTARARDWCRGSS